MLAICLIISDSCKDPSFRRLLLEWHISICENTLKQLDHHQNSISVSEHITVARFCTHCTLRLKEENYVFRDRKNGKRTQLMWNSKNVYCRQCSPRSVWWQKSMLSYFSDQRTMKLSDKTVQIRSPVLGLHCLHVTLPNM